MSNPATLKPFRRRDGTSGAGGKLIGVRLNPDELARLDLAASATGTDRSSVVRGLIGTLPGDGRPVSQTALLRELRRLVDICDLDATLADGSNPDTLGAHALLRAAEGGPSCVECITMGKLCSRHGYLWSAP